MSTEYLPQGVKCNLKCSYCYQEPMRESGNFSTPANLIKVNAILKKDPFTIFGGEPLLTPLDRLEEVFKLGLEHHGQNGIQTNGLLITDRHIELFAKYKVYVGLSLDGSGDMNAPRCCVEDTNKILDNIAKLFTNKIPWSLIITIHRANSDVSRLIPFLVQMEHFGARSINLHSLELDHKANSIALNQEETFDVFQAVYDFSKTSKVLYHPFADIINKLKGTGPANCVWNSCDPLTTPAVQGIGADGNPSNCGRVNKDGIDWMKTEGHGYERTYILHNTPQEHGGCKDCNYFFACSGQCPGTAIDDDWRNRTRDCRFWYNLIEYIEKDMELVTRYEERNSSFIYGLSVPAIGDSHGDIPHGDAPHGDMHGDHDDLTFTTSKGVQVTWIG